MTVFDAVRCALTALFAMTLVAGHTEAQDKPRTQLVVHSTLEPENIAEFKQAFEADNPDIEIVWSRDSTGVLTARIVAEGERQQADAIWGLAVTSISKIKSLGLLVP